MLKTVDENANNSTLSDERSPKAGPKPDNVEELRNGDSDDVELFPGRFVVEESIILVSVDLSYSILLVRPT